MTRLHLAMWLTDGRALPESTVSPAAFCERFGGGDRGMHFSVLAGAPVAFSQSAHRSQRRFAHSWSKHIDTADVAGRYWRRMNELPLGSLDQETLAQDFMYDLLEPIVEVSRISELISSAEAALRFLIDERSAASGLEAVLRLLDESPKIRRVREESNASLDTAAICLVAGTESLSLAALNRAFCSRQAPASSPAAIDDYAPVALVMRSISDEIVLISTTEREHRFGIAPLVCPGQSLARSILQEVDAQAGRTARPHLHGTYLGGAPIGAWLNPRRVD